MFLILIPFLSQIFRKTLVYIPRIVVTVFDCGVVDFGVVTVDCGVVDVVGILVVVVEEVVEIIDGSGK